MSGAQRFLVVGASGLVGGAVVRELRAHGHHVVGASRTPRELATVALDLASPSDIARGLDEARPDVVIVASAWPHVDGCEADPARSRRENVETVTNLVLALAGTETRIVFYSTDHVFDGEKGEPYVEGDAVHPPSVYARDKRAVEQLLTWRGRNLVLRTAWVFGPESRRKNFVYRVIDAAARGAWRDLDRRLRPFIASRVRAEADVDDVVQDVFLRMQRGLDGLRDDERFGPWVYQVARSAIADHRRRAARHPVVEGDPPEEQACPDEGDEGAVERELVTYIAPFVAMLPSPYREALTLTELEGLTQREAAERLGISLSGMKSRVQRGRKLLRSALEDCCFTALDARGRVLSCAPRPDGRLPEGCCK